MSHLKKFSYTESLELKFKGNILWVKRKSKVCKDCSRGALMLKVKMKKILSLSAVRKNSSLHTHTLWALSQKQGVMTSIYLS